jgi:hypothetical protein
MGNAQVTDLKELQKNFDLAAVLAYYKNERLVKWLEERYYEDEAKKIKALDPNASDFKQQLCAALGASYESEADNIDVKAVFAKNEKRERLRQFTADDNMLANVDKVAFSQEDLADLLDNGAKEIYLCGDSFDIPLSKEGVRYIGVKNPNNPVVNIEANELVDFEIKGIFFEGIAFCESYEKLRRECNGRLRGAMSDFCEYGGWIFYFSKPGTITKEKIATGYTTSFDVPTAKGEAVVPEEGPQLLSLDNGWIYYFMCHIVGEQRHKYLYRCKTDGSGCEFFQDTCKAFPDMGLKTHLTFSIYDDKIYFWKWDDSRERYSKFCRMNIDGSNIETLYDSSESAGASYYISDNRVFFAEYERI